MADHETFNGEGTDRLEAILLDYFTARDRGQPSNPEALIASHPEFRRELADFFASEERLHRLAASLSQMTRVLCNGSVPPSALPHSLPSQDDAFPLYGGYELLEEIGRGCVGVVYRARQKSLNRLVALKVFSTDHLTSRDDFQRFRNEAETIAHLDHPHIVPVYEVGEDAGRLYFSMKLLEGGSLARQVARFRSDPQAVARLMTTVAHAVHHAHQRGILHRDLKPSNILLDEKGQPYVSDFGLAKRLESDSELTQSGAIIGTPAYMAPEQATGRREAVTTAADVYGLGAIFYALLAGKPPFAGRNVLETLEQVKTKEPQPPSHIQPAVDRDLETICLKCLEKDATKRYASAEALAEDLERWLRGEPIQARRISRWRRSWRWCRRNPFLATLTALSIALTLALLLGLTVSTWLLVGQQNEIRKQHELTLERERQLRHHLYASDMKVAFQVWKEGGLAQLNELLERHRPNSGKEDLRTFPWYYLRRQADGLKPARALEGHRGDVYFLAYSPDGKTLATAGQDGTARLWDAQSGQERLAIRASTQDIDCVAFSPDGKTLATAGDDGFTRLWETASGHLLAQLYEHPWEVVAVAFSPEGKTLATAGEDGVIRLWDIASRKVTAFLKGPGRIEALSFSPDGKNLISCGGLGNAARAGTVMSWKPPLPNGELIQGIWGRSVPTAAYSHDGRMVALGDEEGLLRLWDPAARRMQDRWHGNTTGSIQWVAFSPDDKLLVATGDNGVRVWDVASRSLRFCIPSPEERVWCAEFSPDGRTLATSGRNGAIRLYDLAEAQPCQPAPTPPLRKREIALSPDGETAAACLDDCSIRTWNVFTGKLGPGCVGHRKGANDMRFRADGKALLTTSHDRTARLWDVATGKPLGPPVPHPEHTRIGALSPDGTIALTQWEDRTHCWKTDSGEEQPCVPFGSTVCDLASSPDGRTLAAVVKDKKLQLWNWQTRRLQHVLPIPEKSEVNLFHASSSFGFSADGSLLAVGYSSGTIQLWHTPTGQKVQTLSGKGRYQTLAISPDGKTLASVEANTTKITLWNVPAGQEVASLEAHTGNITALAFTPDGATLVSASVNGEGQAEIGRWSAVPLDEDWPQK